MKSASLCQKDAGLIGLSAALAREVLSGLLTQLRTRAQDIVQYDDAKIRVLAQTSEPARRLTQVTVIEPQIATALVASMGKPHVFQSGRN